MNQNKMTYLKISMIVYGILLASVFLVWTAAKVYLGIVPTMIFYAAGAYDVLIFSALWIVLVVIVQAVAYLIFRGVKR